ncbi:heterokaryon incompatibility protein-domain-containing protein [Paraphoma chrysanthemicola]|nr:heterokaryon incompatibility protein-domain-containing protein [Paraphoma chrysanthemicola]
MNQAETRLPLYGTLSTQSPVFRLLELQSSDDPADAIACTLEVHRLDYAPPYKALSYAWNEDDQFVPREDDEMSRRRFQVYVRTNHGRGSFEQMVSVSRSLALAMRRLRQRDRPILLWVDSLCINQMDTDERAKQVEMMGMIYQSAAEVVIWLGEREVDDELGEWLQGINQRTVVYSDWNNDNRSQSLVKHYINSYKTLQDNYSGPVTQKRDVYGAFCLIWLLSQGIKSKEIPFYHEKSFTNRFRLAWASQVSDGLRTIMRRNWWRRVWVVQETVLARKATIMYSTLSAPWSMFAKAANLYLQEQLVEDVEQRRVFEGLYLLSHRSDQLRTTDALGGFCETVLAIDSTRQEWASGKPVQLLTLLRRFRSRRATDHRDKVFALLGLVDKWMIIPLSIDYKMTDEMLYMSTAAQIIEETQALSVLCDVTQNTNLAQGSPRYVYSKSWIADWSKVAADSDLERERLSRHQHYFAGRKQGYAFIHDHILETKGLILGTVASIAPNTPQDATERLRRGIGSWEVWWRDGTDAMHGPSPEFAETVCGGLLYRPRLGNTGHISQSAYHRANVEEIQQAYQAWATDTTTARHRRTAMIADLVVNSYKEPEEVTELKNSFYYSVRCATVSRCFFIFNRNVQLRSKQDASSFPARTDIGVGPPSLMVGDKVFLPYGSQVPLIVRPQDYCTWQEGQAGFTSVIGSTQMSPHERRRLIGSGYDKVAKCTTPHFCHNLIGDAYIHGHMNGGELEQLDEEEIVYLA